MASSVGTMIEWYDFYIFGTLAPYLAPKFYPPGNQLFAYIAYLATFAVGFMVRPFGALFFGRIGDLVGRKYAFIVTLTIMGGATALVGALPSYATAGWFSPIILIALRVLQGLALGGEYGGAAIYVAEHVPDDQTRLLHQLYPDHSHSGPVRFDCRHSGNAEPDERSGIQRLGLAYSVPGLVDSGFDFSVHPAADEGIAHLPANQEPGMASAAPLKEAFTKWPNLKQVLISLFGATAGQGVVWYTGQFFALFFMTTILKVPARDSQIIVAKALLIGMPLFVLFGWLSDKIGRKKIIMAGLLLACLTYRIPGTTFGIYPAMQRAAGNNVTHVDASKNKVTGATVLTPQTRDATGKAVPLPQPPTPIRTS